MTPTIILNNPVLRILLCLTVVVLSFNFKIQTLKDGKREV